MPKLALITLFFFHLQNGASLHAEGPNLDLSQLKPGNAPALLQKDISAKSIPSLNTVAADPKSSPSSKVAKNDEDQPAESPKPLDNSQIRKIIASQPDPSMVLEPLAEEPKKPKIVLPKAPPRAPSRPLASTTPVGTSEGSFSKFTKNRTPADAPPVPEVSVILVGRMFYPSRIRLKTGIQAHLYFTTTNEKPAAVIVEQLQIQRWVAKENEKPKNAENDKENTKFEATREVAKNRVSEVILDPRRGTYSFHDAISGAKGQIIVE